MEDKKYYCSDCGIELDKGEGSVFTVCEVCWDKHYKKDNSIPVELPVGMPSENSFGQWVKTTDKFPKPEMMGEKILIVYKNEIHIGKIAPNGWNLFCSDGNCYFHIPIMDEVTHWMPLPKL